MRALMALIMYTHVQCYGDTNSNKSSFTKLKYKTKITGHKTLRMN